MVLSLLLRLEGMQNQQMHEAGDCGAGILLQYGTSNAPSGSRSFVS